jgi:hypothetical protein
MAAAAVAVLACLTGGVDAQPRGAGPAPLAPPDIQAFVGQALADRLAARNIPDQALLDGATRIGVREEMPLSGLRLGAASLPRLAGLEFHLTSASAAQAEADKTRRSVYYLIVDRPAVVGDAATVSLGVDVALPSDPDTGKLCCCSGEGRFRQANGRWSFVSWQQMVCS